MMGQMKLSQPLSLVQYQYLAAFSQTRRQKWRLDRVEGISDPLREAVGLPLGTEGEFCVHGDESRSNLLDGNSPPGEQPFLWCGWTPSQDGTELVFEDERSSDDAYRAGPWLEYLVPKILTPWGITVEGRMWYRDEESAGVVIARGGKVYHLDAVLAYTDPETQELVLLRDNED